MKTIKINSKTIFNGSLAASLVFLTMNLVAQDIAVAPVNEQGVIWSNTKDYSNLGIFKQNDKIFSTNNQVQTLIDDFSINSIHLALPASRKSELKNLVEITCNCNETELLYATSKLPEIFIQPEIGPHYETLFVPNDYAIAFTENYALDLIRAKEAWDVTLGDSSIIIAISDQNFFVDHEELVGKVHHYDTTNLAPKTHGTAVAVTAAGNTNNNLGMSSIGYNSQLALYSMSYNDLLIATYSGYRVINTSWTSGCTESMYTQNIVDEIYENGSIIVAAAGNGSTCGGPMNLVYPAACNHVISVTGIGSTDNAERTPGDSLSTFQHNSDVDISAPGILVPLTTSLGNYLVGNGTSFSAPFVSGTIALMLSVDSCLTFEDVETILYSTAVNIDSLNPDYAGLLGHGRLDAGAAVLMASQYMSCSGAGGGEGSIDTELTEEYINEYDDNTNSLVGLEELNETNEIEFKVYPSPAVVGKEITVASSELIEQCEIHSVNGEIVQVINPNSDTFKVLIPSQGIFFVQVKLGNGITKVKRVMVY